MAYTQCLRMPTISCAPIYIILTAAVLQQSTGLEVHCLFDLPVKYSSCTRKQAKLNSFQVPTFSVINANAWRCCSEPKSGHHRKKAYLQTMRATPPRHSTPLYMAIFDMADGCAFVWNFSARCYLPLPAVACGWISVRWVGPGILPNRSDLGQF